MQIYINTCRNTEINKAFKNTELNKLINVERKKYINAEIQTQPQ